MPFRSGTKTLNAIFKTMHRQLTSEVEFFRTDASKKNICKNLITLFEKSSDELKKEKYTNNKEHAEFACDPNAWSKPN